MSEEAAVKIVAEMRSTIRGVMSEAATIYRQLERFLELLDNLQSALSKSAPPPSGPEKGISA